jgi:predicted DNA-binding transcriptional regulator AlpA
MDTNQRLLRFLNASPEQQVQIDQILEGKPKPEIPTAPLLLSMSKGSEFLGVGRCTLWRMIRAGKLCKVEVLNNSFRVRKSDLEAIAAGKTEESNENRPR